MADLHHRGLGRRQGNALLRQRGVVLRQFHRGLLHLPGGLIGSLAQFLQPLGKGEKPVTALLNLALLLGHLLPLARNLLVHVLAGTGGLFHLALQPVEVLPVVGGVIFQKARLSLCPNCLFIQGSRLGAGLLHPHGAPVYLPEVFLGALGNGLDLLLQLPVLGLGQGDFLPVLSQHPAGAVQGLQPNADLQALLLLVQGDELLRLFRLEAQGLHPALQLREDVPQAHQVLLSLVQVALRLLFAVAVAGDARRLLKNLPAVLGTGGHNAVYLALADNGIAVPSQARVHKELVDIL